MRRFFIHFCIILLLFGSGYTYAEQSSSDNALSQVDRIWHQALADKLNIQQDQLRLYQGGGTIPYTSQEMWNIFNAIPTAQTDYYYNPSQYNSFSSAYNLILYGLKPVSDSGFQNCMGNYYMQWLDYLKKNPRIHLIL